MKEYALSSGQTLPVGSVVYVVDASLHLTVTGLEMVPHSTQWSLTVTGLGNASMGHFGTVGNLRGMLKASGIDGVQNCECSQLTILLQPIS